MKDEIKKMLSYQDERENTISIISHDLKGPFNRIYALLNLMEMSASSDDFQHSEYLNKMNQAVKEGMMLIKNILDLQKMERGETSVNIAKVNLNRLIKSISSDYGQHGKYKDISFEFAPKEEYEIETDEFYLVRLLDNLLSNALKFSPVGSVVLIDVESSSDTLSIVVRNEGEQLRQEEVDLLFRSYTQLSVKPTMGESSSGIGLAIVRLIAQALGYKVRYEPWENKGSNFIVEIPMEAGSHPNHQ
jgi:signal transduction histidine kinase